MIEALLHKTSLQAKVGNALSTPFSTHLHQQGDSLSPVLFAIYLELVRSARMRPKIDELIPKEIIYVDGTDFISHSAEHLKSIEAEASQTLGRWNLIVNESKTERTTITRLQTKEEED